MFTLLASDSFVSTKSVFTYPICDSPLWRLARRSFTLLQKLHRNHRKLECRVYEHLKFSGVRPMIDVSVREVLQQRLTQTKGWQERRAQPTNIDAALPLQVTNQLLLLKVRLRAPANRKFDCTARFITMTTRLFFAFYQKRRKFARVATTTSVIGKEPSMQTSFPPPNPHSPPPLAPTCCVHGIGKRVGPITANTRTNDKPFLFHSTLKAICKLLQLMVDRWHKRHFSRLRPAGRLLPSPQQLNFPFFFAPFVLEPAPSQAITRFCLCLIWVSHSVIDTQYVAINKYVYRKDAY